MTWHILQSDLGLEGLIFTQFELGYIRSRFTTDEEVDFVVKKVVQHVEKLRDMSPLWELVQEGVDLKSIHWAH